MHIEYRITEKDYRAAALLSMRRRSTLSSLEYYGPYFFCIIWLSVSVVPATIHPDANLNLLLTLGVLPIVLGFLALRHKQIRHEYAKQKNFHLNQVLDLDRNGLRVVTSEGTALSSWQVYSKFAEGPKTFLLFLQGGHAFLPIPKGQLTLAEIDELRALLKARLPSE